MKRKTMRVAITLMIAMGMVACGSDNVNEWVPQPEEETENTTSSEDPEDDNGQNNGNEDPSDDDGDYEPLSNENNYWRPISLTPAELSMVDGSNNFAFNLMRKVDELSEDKNASIVLSPLSITFALGMLNNGATGETQAQINRVLGFENTGAEGINNFCHKMLKESSTLDKLTKVSIANNIYLHDPQITGHNLFPDFVKKAYDYYDAVPEVRNFFDGETCDVINQWASDHTEGMIEKVVKETDFEDSNLFLFLLNAIYFKGAWCEPFDKENTREEVFEGAEQKVPMMHQQKEFSYTENDLCQALQMPYGNKAYSMTILLPQQGKTVEQVLQSLTTDSWQKNYRYMDDAIVDVKLPRFESNANVELIEVMESLGMPFAFDAEKAEFWNLSDFGRMWISIMRQVARIKVNEQGAEAAAVTVIGVDGKDCCSKPKYATFHATHPFLYVISERSTGAIFFIGKYMGD